MSRSLKTCICNKCNTEIEINIQEAVIDSDTEDKVVDQFFVCPECNARYTVCIYDNYMRKRIVARKLLVKSRYNRKRDEQLVKEMQDHFKELKAKYNRD